MANYSSRVDNLDDVDGIKKCKRCNSTDTVLESRVTSSGHKVTAMYCRQCRQEVKVTLDTN